LWTGWENMRGFFTLKGKHIFVYDMCSNDIDSEIKALGEIKTFGCPNFYSIGMKTANTTKRAANFLVEKLYAKVEFDEFIERLAKETGLLKLVSKVE